MRVGVAVEVPGRVDECVHGIGLAPCGTSTFGARRVHEFGNAPEWRTARQRDVDAVGKNDGQVLLRHRDDAIFLAVQHRNGRTPVALARDAPVLDSECDGGFAEAVLFRVLGHLLESFLTGETAELTRVHHQAVFSNEW